jgi:23S rRNA (guanine745-N1)-methyltransferase
VPSGSSSGARRRETSQTLASTSARGGGATAKEGVPTPLAALASRLRCPNCGASLIHADRALRCDRGHSFDLARQGHVALLAPGRRIARGDSQEMVAAREAFLGTGHYSPIAEAITASAQAVSASSSERCIVDLGAGVGYYLAALLDEDSDALGLALDASRAALRRAMRAHPRIAGVACDVWRELPLRDATADLIVNVFAPRNGPEIARILSARGALVVTTPTPRHLHELVGALDMLRVDADKQARLHAGLPASLAPVSRRRVEFAMTLGQRELRSLVAMGPSARHLDADDVRERLARGFGADVRVTASVIVETFRRA